MGRSGADDLPLDLVPGELDLSMLWDLQQEAEIFPDGVYVIGRSDGIWDCLIRQSSCLLLASQIGLAEQTQAANEYRISFVQAMATLHLQNSFSTFKATSEQTDNWPLEAFICSTSNLHA